MRTLKPYPRRPDYDTLMLKAKEKAESAEKALAKKSYALCFMHKKVVPKRLLEPELTDLLKAHHSLCMATHRACLERSSKRSQALKDLDNGVTLEGFLGNEKSIKLSFSTGGVTI